MLGTLYETPRRANAGASRYNVPMPQTDRQAVLNALRAKAAGLPAGPGACLFKDAADVVLYHVAGARGPSCRGPSR